jgi:hypothetical protein
LFFGGLCLVLLALLMVPLVLAGIVVIGVKHLLGW